MFPSDMKCHPVLEGYAATQDGQVWNVDKRRRLQGRLLNGYRMLSFSNTQKKMQIHAHRFVYECFHGQLDCGLEIDHIDSNKTNNTLSNLQALTRLQHVKITRERERAAGGRSEAGRFHPVQRIAANGTSREFCSLKEAKQETPSANCRKIILCLQGKRKTHAGYRWTEIGQEDLEGEVWCSLFDFPGLQISNKGRAKGLKQRPKVGFLNAAGYRATRFRLQNLPIHRLVCLAFHGRQPSAQHTADHINRNKQDNAAINLRWANKQEQAENKASTRAVTSTCLLTGLKRTYQSMAAATRETTVHRKCVRQAISGQTTRGGHYTWTDTPAMEVPLSI